MGKDSKFSNKSKGKKERLLPLTTENYRFKRYLTTKCEDL